VSLSEEPCNYSIQTLDKKTLFPRGPLVGGGQGSGSGLVEGNWSFSRFAIHPKEQRAAVDATSMPGDTLDDYSVCGRALRAK